MALQIKLTSVMVDDQEKALRFYTEKLAFVKKHDVPAGGARWLTVVSPENPNDPELLLEPMGMPAAARFQKALYDAGVPLTAFAVADTRQEYERLNGLGVRFQGEPQDVGPTVIAVFDDTCGNWIQIYQG